MSTDVRQNDLLIGGVPVEYHAKTGTLHLAGQSFSVEEWLEFRRRIDLVLKHVTPPERWNEIREAMARQEKVSRLPLPLRTHQAQPTFTTSSFLGENIAAINSLERGRLKRAPRWLRWAYDAVVTKERYGKE